jgi:hypothetical protein
MTAHRPNLLNSEHNSDHIYRPESSFPRISRRAAYYFIKFMRGNIIQFIRTGFKNYTYETNRQTTHIHWCMQWTHWIHTWSYLQPLEQCDAMDSGCNRLETVARNLFNQYGWRRDFRIMSSWVIMISLYLIFRWLIHVATLVDPWLVISIWERSNNLIK